MTMTPLLVVDNLSKRFGGLLANEGISFQLGAAQIVGLIGPNGAGKTTLFNCIAGFFPPAEGSIRFLGKDIAGLAPAQMARLGIARTFQIVRSFGSLTVLENVSAPLMLGKKLPRDAARKKAAAALAQVGMSDKADARPAKLSGGQQQRVGIARALALEPELLLLDEPTSALDPERVEEVLDVIKVLANDGMTMVMVTHEMSFAAKISSRVVFMAEGSIIETGAPATLFRQPQTERLRSFLAPWFKRPLQLDEPEAGHA